jgi:probable 2-oxoglutarate dehydrogenase E1 component DHKTD1
VHPRLEKLHIGKRLASLDAGRDIDFATAEALAFGSLLLDGYHVRLSGQDVGRGTFSQRHVLLADQKTTSAAVVPLNSLAAEGKLEVANSPLSEFAILVIRVVGSLWAVSDLSAGLRAGRRVVVAQDSADLVRPTLRPLTQNNP